jgi:hypothetical protein
MRKILRRMDESAPKAGEAAKRLNAEDGITVLDEKPSSLLVEGDEDMIAEAIRKIGGWTAFNFGKIDVPDTRPRVSRRPRETS